MASNTSRFFQPVVAKKRKVDEDPIVPESRGTVDEGTTGSSSSSTIKTDSQSTTLGNATNPFMICDDSDSDVEVLIMEDTVRLGGPVDESEMKEAQDGNNVKDDEAQSSRDSPPLPEELPKNDLERKENPFSKFAFAAGGGSQATQPPRPTLLWRSLNMTTTGGAIPSVSAKRSNHAALSKAIKPGLASSNIKGNKKKSCDFLPMRSIPKEEQDKITRKWHSLADPAAPLQVRRFQVLLAARLHARCQEPSVRKAMSVLRSAFTDLTVSAVAQADPEILALHLTNLQYYNTKAQQIVKAAKEIETEFHGIVPEDETSLLRLTGVGKVFADLLAFVNTREIHERFETEAPALAGITGNEEKKDEAASDAVEP